MNLPKLGTLGFKAAGIAATVGAGVGAYSEDQDRGHGALVGAGVGLAAITGARMFSNIKAMPKLTKSFQRTPMKGMAGVVIGATGALAAGAAMAPSNYESESKATPNGMGGRDTETQYTNYQYSLSDRLASMNVSGDIVFGLHNKRHG